MSAENKHGYIASWEIVVDGHKDEPPHIIRLRFITPQGELHSFTLSKDKAQIVGNGLIAASTSDQPCRAEGLSDSIQTDRSVSDSWKDRVRAENTELVMRMSLLDDFIKCPLFEGLDEEDRNLLLRQRDVMEVYHETLFKRIARFT